MSKIKYRDITICNEIARGYLSFVKSYQTDLRTQFERATMDEVTKHLTANPNSLSFGQAIKIRPTSEILMLAQQQQALEILMLLVKTYSNGVSANLILATEKDRDLQTFLIEHTESPKTSRFFEICEKKGIFEPKAVFSKTQYGENHFRHQAWESVKSLVSSFQGTIEFPNKEALLSKLTQEIDKNIKALPARVTVEKGIDFEI